MNKKTKYIVFEGGEGTYKTSTITAVAAKLRECGYSVLETKEPGTPHIPLTLELRKIMLSNEYDDVLPVYAREFISQAIRQTHIEKLIRPAYASGEYDFILQDRGILSGIIYAIACGATQATQFTPFALGQSGVVGNNSLYHLTVVLHREAPSVEIALNAKQEFVSGDAMESRGDEFHTFVSNAFKASLREDSPLSEYAHSERITGIRSDQFDGNRDGLVNAAMDKVMREFYY